jgi:hypothetical protein
MERSVGVRDIDCIERQRVKIGDELHSFGAVATAREGDRLAGRIDAQDFAVRKGFAKHGRAVAEAASEVEHAANRPVEAETPGQRDALPREVLATLSAQRETSSAGFFVGVDERVEHLAGVTAAAVPHTRAVPSTVRRRAGVR